MSYRKSYMGPNDRYMGDVAGDAVHRQQDAARERDLDAQRALADEDDEAQARRRGTSSDAGLLETLFSGAVGALAILAFLPGAVMGVVLFIKLIGGVTESWHVLALVGSFVIGGVVAMALVVAATALVLTAGAYALRSAWSSGWGLLCLAFRA